MDPRVSASEPCGFFSGTIVQSLGGRPRLHKEIHDSRRAAALANNIPSVLCQIFRSVAFQYFLCYLFGPNLVDGFTRDFIDLETGACRPSRPMAEASIVQVRQVGKRMRSVATLCRCNAPWFAAMISFLGERRVILYFPGKGLGVGSRGSRSGRVAVL